MLPVGWDLARIRRLVPEAELLEPTDHDVFFDEGGDYVPLDAGTIIDCGGQCLVLADPEDGWWMGLRDSVDGSIVCGGTYANASDLERAIAAL